ncbi:unnamed protein product [Arctia plantaginis]|uniref:Uncharacterized protein n=1 Tax=Arctia plantaginis TaxID=874455 RepID=A0A8S0ZXC9_ARCPL|nr:unnamed protein product [Arctia plantaginis]
MATCCVPCPAAAPCAMSAGIKSGLRDDKPIDGKQDCGNYACDSCCRRPSMFGPCYKQPRIPDSYAPRRCYMRPCAPMQSTTTYNMSYLPATGCSNLRGMMRKPLPNLVPSCEPMESCTIQKLSFLPNPVHVTQPIRPCHHDMWGQGPMQNITTQRHDYVPKPSIPRPSCRPPHKFHCIEQPFERRTINRLSYVDPGRCPVTPSYAPLNCYERASGDTYGMQYHSQNVVSACVCTTAAAAAVVLQGPVPKTMPEAGIGNDLQNVFPRSWRRLHTIHEPLQLWRLQTVQYFLPTYVLYDESLLLQFPKGSLLWLETNL